MGCFVILVKFPGSNYPGDDPNDGRPPFPPGWRPSHQPPPSYDETFKGGNTRNTNTSGGSNYGFFSGLGLGALGGYLMGNRGTGWG